MKSKLILLSLLFFGSILGYSAEYKAEPMSIDTYSTTGIQWKVSHGLGHLNNKGQVLGVLQPLQWIQNGAGQSIVPAKLFLFDPLDGLHIIEHPEQFLSAQKFNNHGQVLGLSQRGYFIWDTLMGFTWLDTLNAGWTRVNDFNSAGQIIGIHSPVPGQFQQVTAFIWRNGVITNMGPGSDFAKQIEALGYHVDDIQLSFINDRGEIGGHFWQSRFNPKQNHYVKLTQPIPFFYDGRVHIFPESDKWTDKQVIGINNNRAVLIQVHSTTNNHRQMVWTIDKGIDLLPLNFFGSKINDSGTILGFQQDTPLHNPVLGILRGGQFFSLSSLLEVDDIKNISPAYSEDFAIEGIGHVVGLNNKGEILCPGQIWGEEHPAILKPIGSQKSQ